ncbi:hypothetical protein SCUP234_08964 [Seiridium cupressi]
MFNAKTIYAAAGLLAATTVNGHLVLTDPQPHDFIHDDNPQRPLDASGSDFPCRNTGASWTGPVNSYALGSKQQLAFLGSAVHGGGSCQVSITYDTAPTKASKFKVIHTIQGGCPARDTAGNIGTTADMVDPFTYDYTIPTDIPAGNATIAWSWINRVGNREYYMQCGVLELTGTGGDQANFDKLPDLFVANLDGVSDGCTTTVNGAEVSSDFLIPDPGDSVETNSMVSPVSFDSSCKSVSGGSGGSAGTTAAATTSVAATTSLVSSATSVPGGVFITKTTQATTTAAPATTSVASVASSSVPVASASSGSSTGTGQQKTGSCDTSGMFNCISGTSYQQCASGTWSVVMPLAAGTSCTVGESTDMKIAAAGRRMAMRALKN